MTFEEWWAKEFSNVNIQWYENSSDALTKEWFNIVKRAFEDGKSATPSEDAEIARLNRNPIPVELLEIVRDTLEYWINRVDTRGMSKADYNSWLALGHHSKAMTALRALLGKEDDK